MKKFMCLCLALTLFCCVLVPVNASDEISEKTDVNSAIKNAISQELSYYENSQHLIGVQNADFSKLVIGEGISVYEYTYEGFIHISNAYMIYENDAVMTLAYQINDTTFQFMTDLAKRIDEIKCSKVALIYDINGCYIWNGYNFIQIYNTFNAITGRNNVLNCDKNEKSVLQLSDLNNKQKLVYKTNLNNARTQVNFFCSVNYVTQQPYENICWAACLAMISNTINNTSLDAVDVARGVLGDDFDFAAPSYYLQILMNGSAYGYNLNYTHKSIVPSDNIIFQNIQDATPVCGGFVSDEKEHLVIVNGINLIAGRIMIIDPMFGSTSGYKTDDGGYSYVSSITGEIWTFDSAICRSW